MDAEPRDVRAHMERVANNPIFAESERLRRFLRFTVESKLRGEHDRVKEYVLGREVFDRTDEYDPRLDPIVRVEARRLRSKLSEYYNGPGKAERLRIDYPKGSYLPNFVNARDVRGGAFTKRRVGIALTVVVLLALAFVATYAFRAASGNRAALVAVLPVQWVWREDPGQDPSAIGLAEALDAEIANRNLARVVAWPVAAQQRDALRSLADVPNRLGASRVIGVGVRQVDRGESVTIFLVDAISGQKLRADEYFAKNIRSYWIQKQLARRIADDLRASGRL